MYSERVILGGYNSDDELSYNKIFNFDFKKHVNFVNSKNRIKSSKDNCKIKIANMEFKRTASKVKISCKKKEILKPLQKDIQYSNIYNNRGKLITDKVEIENYLNRKFKCNICYKRFKRINAYQDHLNLHNNIRRYSCNYCNKKFVQNSNLKSHIKLNINCLIYSKTNNDNNNLNL